MSFDLTRSRSQQNREAAPCRGVVSGHSPDPTSIGGNSGFAVAAASTPRRFSPSPSWMTACSAVAQRHNCRRPIQCRGNKRSSARPQMMCPAMM
jgi:hypothetical protein